MGPQLRNVMSISLKRAGLNQIPEYEIMVQENEQTDVHSLVWYAYGGVHA